MLDSNDLCLLTLASDHKIASTSLLATQLKSPRKFYFGLIFRGLSESLKCINQEGRLGNRPTPLRPSSPFPLHQPLLCFSTREKL